MHFSIEASQNAGSAARERGKMVVSSLDALARVEQIGRKAAAEIGEIRWQLHRITDRLLYF